MSTPVSVSPAHPSRPALGPYSNVTSISEVPVKARSRFLVAAVAPAILFLLLVGPPALAQGAPGIEKNKCLATKNKCASKVLAGLLKCRELCQKTPAKCGQVQLDCEAKVRAKFDGGETPEKGCFAKAEAKATLAKPDSICATTGDTTAFGEELEAVTAELLDRLEGTPPPSCGDGVVNVAGEQCDGDDLDGYSCSSFGRDGPLGCDGTCRFDAARCFDCTASGGASEGGACWFLGGSGQSCATACAAVGLSYDEATRTFAGSEGTNGNCAAVLSSFSIGFSGGGPNVGVGCVQESGLGAGRDKAPTTAAASCPICKRACACAP